MKILHLYSLLTVSILALVLLHPCAVRSQESDSCADGESGTCRSYNILGKPEEFVDGTLPGVKLAVRRWIPTNQEPKAVILFLHGGAGFHSGYSETMGTFQQENGIAVVAFDTMGSGYSTGADDLRNYFPSMPALTEEFSTMLRRVKGQYPGKKVYAMGESFGGMVLANQILEEQPKNDGMLADGYIFSGPVIKVLPEMLPPKFVIKILVFFAQFFPMAKMPGTDVFSTFDLAFGDQGWAKAGRADPFVQEAAKNPPRLGMAASLLSSMDDMYSRLNEVKVPFKIFTGEFEQRVDTDAIQHFFKVASSNDKAMEIVDGAYHQLFQDLPEVTAKVNAGVRDWVLERA